MPRPWLSGRAALEDSSTRSLGPAEIEALLWFSDFALSPAQLNERAHWEVDGGTRTQSYLVDFGISMGFCVLAIRSGY